MNMLFIKHFFVGFMVSEIPRVSLFGHCPYSVTFPYVYIIIIIRLWYKYLGNCRSIAAYRETTCLCT